MDKYYLLVDIDGTLSDASKRAKKYLGGDVPDWDGFYNACGEVYSTQFTERGWKSFSEIHRI